MSTLDLPSVFAAHRFAIEAHNGEVRRDSGEPYVKHVERVAANVHKNYDADKSLLAGYSPTELVIAALLHDTLENTDVDIEEIECGFGTTVGSLVVDLTSDPNEIKRIGKTAYLEHKLPLIQVGALFIKLYDRLDNVTDFVASPDRERARKYAEQTLVLLRALGRERFPLAVDEIRAACEKMLQ